MEYKAIPMVSGFVFFNEEKGSKDWRGDIRIYEHVKIKEMVCTKGGVIHKMYLTEVKNINWSRSKRLIPGSLLCISQDMFTNYTWALVVKR